jgi:DNA-binding winged helix-turn-helix (wHTH) protein
LKTGENLRTLPGLPGPLTQIARIKLSVIQFEKFTLDPDRRSLDREGHHVALRPQAMEVLCYLAKNPGRPVSKEELFREIWQGISAAAA